MRTGRERRECEKRRVWWLNSVEEEWVKGMMGGGGNGRKVKQSVGQTPSNEKEKRSGAENMKK